MDFEGLLVPLGAFAMVFGIVYIVVTARNRERLAMIERGADASLFETTKKNHSHGVLKGGLFLLGIGIGIAVANILESNGVMNESAYPSMILVFGGLALIIAHFYSRKLDREENTGV